MTVSIPFTPDPALPCFQGHFPGRPLVPAFLQIEWIRRWASMHFDTGLTRFGIRSAKFLSPMVPGKEYEAKLSFSPDSRILRFEVRQFGELVSTGSISFGESPPSR